MRRARLKVPADAPVGYYHCQSRVVNREFIPHETEKDQFVSLMREHEDFREVEVLRYCVMDNHFHVLLDAFGSRAKPRRCDSTGRAKLQHFSFWNRRRPSTGG